jgi:hypothetical protein
MSYQPFLIADYSTGVDKQLQPWLLSNDAFVDLFDGFVYRGVSQNRNGYSGFATGLKSTYCESRMVVQVTAATMAGAINGANKTFTASLTAPVRRGTTVVSGSDPVQTATDNGLGGFTGDVDTLLSSIDYTTGAVTIVWNAAPIAASTVTVTYDYHQGNPVMGIMNFFPNELPQQLVVVDTQYVNIYDPVTDRLVYKSAAFGPYNGDNQDFYSWVNYADNASVERLLFCNGAKDDVIQQWDGTNVTDYVYTLTGITALNARQMFEVRDRLVLFQTWETVGAGTPKFFPRRIRISGTGANSDIFDITATGAGFIDIPDNTFFYGAAFNRDDIMFFTEAATWMLKYTGNDVKPFTLEKIDGSRGSKAAFSVISYLNRTMAASPRGLIISNGYSLERMDENIPEFTYNNIDNEYFESCFSAFLDEERDVYMLYRSKTQEDSPNYRPSFLENESSDQILVSNFEEDNFSIYRLPLSCLGNFVSADNLTWADLTAANGFPNWESLAANFSSWKAFPYSKDVPVTLGGGHKGEIFEMNVDQGEDNIQKVRGIAIIDDNTLEITTDWNNYEIGDYIFLTGLSGMTQADNKQYAIKARTDYYTFQVQCKGALSFSPWTSGGEASRVIPFEALTKQFNPYVNYDKKIRVGWAYFYVSIAKTSLTTLDAEGVEQPDRAYLNIDVYTNDNYANATDPTFQYKVDCTNLQNVTGSKAWVKIWINQTAQFVQFRLHNTQAGAEMKIHAMMLGLQGLGRLV